ncbi:hypothetical protein [Streptomyces violaceusniger]|uniref:hypothetical protein n=1 Tax=Streptomyces violaceusniger TaxID=68280 RepID=UPI000997AA51|nr:hypothetical protein [Streptomyces hygroscopicus]AQW51751.1 hypothetical protein SHXM_05214 [Streptomyces hygroscopicus]ASQ95501.1 hypothetical protein CGL27_22665 [Streptomyces sp. 11-1-2]
MSVVFGPNSRRVLQFLTHIEDLTPEEIDRVADLWKQTSSQTRAEGWAVVHRTTTPEERYRILVAASVARRAALDAAQNHQRHDWAFWAAVWDAATAVAVCDRIGSHYNVLVAPLAAVMPSLAHCRRDEFSIRELQGAVLKGGG